MEERVIVTALTEPLPRAVRDLMNPGPVKWCKRCSRKHPSRQPCDLVKVAVEAKSGRMVERWIHPSARSDT